MPSAPAPISPETARARRSRTIWLGRALLALATPVLFLLGLEGGLRLCGFGRNPHFFIPDGQPGVYRTNPRFTETFFAASFGLKPLNFRLPQHKPPGSVRIFVLGESAAMGVPEPGFAFAPQLRAQLRAAYPGKSIDVYNLGITAINSHVIRLIANEAAEFEPDVFVIYMGNNEVVGPYGPGSAISDRVLPLAWVHASTWARETRTGQLLQWIGSHLHRGRGFRDWRGMEMFAGRTVAADDPRLAEVYRHFEANLADILAAAHRAGAKVVLSTVAVDLGDCAPFASLHRAGISATDLEQWGDALQRGIEADELGQAAEARTFFARAARLDPQHAETQFRLARALVATGDIGGAREHYAAALQYDALRFRADAAINAIIRRAAAQDPAGITLVDAAREMGATVDATAPISNHRQFFEHVHLTWGGNYELSRLLAPATGVAAFNQPVPPNRWLSSDSCAARVGFTPIGRMAMLTQMQGLTGRPPFTGQYTFAADRTQLQDAIAAAGKALRSGDELRSAILTIETALDGDPQNAFLVFHMAAAYAQVNRTRQALAANERLDTLEPVSAENLAQRAFLLASAGETAAAEKTLLQSARLEPYYFQTYELLGQLWAGAQEFGKARTYFGTLLPKMPDSLAVRLTYAQVLAASGEWTAADAQWRAVLERSPDNEAALEPLVRRLMNRKESDAALDLMLKAHRYNPRDFANNERLIQFYAGRGDKEKTVEFMQALSDSGPVTPALYADLGGFMLDLGRRRDALIEFVKARRAAESAGDSDVLKRATDAIRANHLDQAK